MPSIDIWNDMTTISSIGTYTFRSTDPTAYTITNGSGATVVSVPQDSDPALKVTGDIVLNEESLTERLERIEAVLHIPTRDVTIEEQYPKLKEIYKEYMTELEKYKTWNRLKKGTEK
jgi:hypothetical protein